MTSFRDFSGREWVITRGARRLLTWGLGVAIAIVIFFVGDGARFARIAFHEACVPGSVLELGHRGVGPRVRYNALGRELESRAIDLESTKEQPLQVGGPVLVCFDAEAPANPVIGHSKPALLNELISCLMVVAGWVVVMRLGMRRIPLG